MMNIELIPMRADNYTFLITCRHDSKSVWVVDPSEAKIVEILKKRNLQVEGVLNTHHHDDHIAGNDAIVQEWQCPVLCSTYDQKRIPTHTRGLSDQEECDIGGWHMKTIATPGHTLGAVCFIFQEGRSVFVGDTLFAMGCGRLFEGTPKQMLESLHMIASLPDDYKIYCGHEYTVSNGQFAQHIDPQSEAVAHRLPEAQKTRKANTPTIPTTVQEEWATNPFLQVFESRQWVTDTLEKFTSLRQQKDNF